MKISALLSFSALSAVYMASLTSAQLLESNVACKMPGVVAYTYDDGPGIYNDQLLAILARKNVKVTFYMLGRMIDESPAQAASLKKILAAGHQLASHSYSHSNLSAMTVAAREKEMNDTAEAMFKNSGVRPRYMRAPEGNCDAACVAHMQKMGLFVSLWSADTHDWQFANLPSATAVTKSMAEIEQKIITNSNPATDSFIILQHEIHKFSVEALTEVLIDKVAAKGYRFVTMEECIGQPAYLDGSTVPQPPATNPTTPSPPGTNPTTPNNGAAPSASSGPSTPTTGPSPPSTGSNNASGPKPVVEKKPENSANVKQLGAWAMGIAALASYLLV